MSKYLDLMEYFRPLISIGYEITVRMNYALDPDISKRTYEITIESLGYYCQVEHADLEEAAQQVWEHRVNWEMKINAIQEEEKELSAVGSGDRASDTDTAEIQKSRP